MATITRILTADYGHRVLGHEGKCRHIHGHHGKIEVTVSSPALDALGRVVDFGVIKNMVGSWIDNHWDHNIILHEDDPLLHITQDHTNTRKDILDLNKVWASKDPYVLTGKRNPTAENLAQELFDVCKTLFADMLHITVRHVRFWETENCYADYPT